MNVEIRRCLRNTASIRSAGCLPMIIQMPFLLAFYTMLGVATSCARRIGCGSTICRRLIRIHILPVLIVVRLSDMQQMTPNPGMDPSQQKMMNFFMPVMLGGSVGRGRRTGRVLDAGNGDRGRFSSL